MALISVFDVLGPNMIGHLVLIQPGPVLLRFWRGK